MSLTIGTGPFGRTPGGIFNFEASGPEHVLYFEDSPRRVRGVLAGATVVDSRHAKLLHETGHLPIYYFPRDEVRMDLLEPSAHSTHCPFKGDAVYWNVRVGDRVVENAVWGYPEPLPEAPPIADHVAFYFRLLDEWWEEDERIHVHPRDPYHRVDVLPSSRHVRVSLEGEVLAESERPLVLFETGLPPRYYLPREDVRADVLEASDKRTRCPYKGEATYWSVRSDGIDEEDLVWCYADPLRAVEEIAGRLCFFNERVDLEIDGEVVERPITQWSAPEGRRQKAEGRA
jgi:uncharacterized protein (DUF427 family)